MLTRERLLELWDFDGHQWTNRKSGRISTSDMVRVDDKLYRKHRLKVFLETGEFPLKALSAKRPRKHPTKRHSDREDGTPGVYRTSSNKFEARICIDSKQILLGTFESEDDAVTVRRYAESLVYNK